MTGYSVVLGLAIARGADQRFHMIQITLERAASNCRQPVLRLRHATLERFRAGDVIRLLELARVYAQIAVGCLHQLLEVAERQRIVDGERADDSETKSLVYQP